MPRVSALKIRPATLPARGPLGIGVFAPSEPITPERFAQIQANARALRKNGFRVRFSRNLRARRGSVAGSVDQRLDDIRDLLQDSAVNVLIAAWGGKGCIELIADLPYKMFARRRLPVLGTSDTGVLLNAITATAGVVTFYGPSVFGKLDDSDWADLRFLQRSEWQTPGAEIISHDGRSKTIRRGHVRGLLYGGDLDTFVHGIAGTPYSPPHIGSILFIECGRYDPQRIRQQFAALSIRGVLGEIAGLLIGHLGHKQQSRWPVPPRLSTVRELTADLAIPVLYAPVFGHGRLPNPALPIGAMVSLDATKQQLVLESPSLTSTS